MPLSRKEKEEIVGGYEAGLAAAPNVFVLGYKGITVPQVTELRSRVRQGGGRYLVVKNTLVERALAGGALVALRDHFQGPTAVAYSERDAVALAKVLTEFAKDVPAIEFKGGLVEGKPVSGVEVETIAKLPGKGELVARLLFLLQSPARRLARTLAALPRGLVVALDQIRARRENR